MFYRPVLWLGLAYITGELAAWIWPGVPAFMAALLWAASVIALGCYGAAAACRGVALGCHGAKAGCRGTVMGRHGKAAGVEARLKNHSARSKKNFYAGRTRKKNTAIGGLLFVLPVFLLGGYLNFTVAIEQALESDLRLAAWIETEGEQAGTAPPVGSGPQSSGAAPPDSSGPEAGVMAGRVTSVEEKANSWYVFVEKELLVSVSKEDYPELGQVGLPGCQIAFEGEVELFSHPANEGAFDEWLYYHSRGIRARVWADTLTMTGDEASFWARAAAALRQWMKDNCARYLDETSAGVAVSMVCGDKSMLDSDLKALYQLSGISHILAISGLHISFIGMGIYQLLCRLRLPQYFCLGAGLGLMAVYGWFTGMAPSTLRAVTMTGLSLGAKLLGRTYDRPTGLSLAAMIILIPSPLMVTQPGFLLSFIAAGSLVLCPPTPAAAGGRVKSPPTTVAAGGRVKCPTTTVTAGGQAERSDAPGNALRKMAVKLFGRPSLGGAMARLWRTLCAPVFVTVGMLPAIAWCFYEIPVYSILVNLAVIPLMSLAYPVMLICALAGPLLGPLASLPGWLIEGILAVYQWLCRLSLELPGAVLIVGKPGAGTIAIFYGLFLAAAAAAWLAARGHKLSARNQEPWARQAAPKKTAALKRKRRPEAVQERPQWKNMAGLGRTAPAACGFSILLALLGIFLLTLPMRPREMTVTMVDVGQGDCFFIQLPDGTNILIDGGSTDEKNMGQYILEPFLKSRGVRALDAVFLSHMDADHINGIQEMLSGALWEPPGGDGALAKLPGGAAASDTTESAATGAASAVMTENAAIDTAASVVPGSIVVKNLLMPWNVQEGGGYETLFSLAQSLGVPCLGLAAGDRLSFGGLVLTVISPGGGVVSTASSTGAPGGGVVSTASDTGAPGGGAVSTASDSGAPGGAGIVLASGAGSGAFDRNDESLVFHISYGNFDMLFTGDVGSPVEDQILENMQALGLGSCDVLKVAHHGSRESSSRDFLDYVRPLLALISCGADNSYGHPHKELLERLSQTAGEIFITAQNGETMLITDGNFIKTVVWKGEGSYNNMQEVSLDNEIQNGQ